MTWHTNYNPALCASKHGINAFAEALRVELRLENTPIRVTSIQPATTNTPFFDKSRTKLGVKPVAPPPIYQPHIVIDAILYAAENPVRDVVVGGAAKAMILTQRLAPGLLDALLAPIGYEMHNTHEPKPATAPTTCLPLLKATTRWEAPLPARPCVTACIPGSKLTPSPVLPWAVLRWGGTLALFNETTRNNAVTWLQKHLATLPTHLQLLRRRIAPPARQLAEEVYESYHP